VPAAPGGFFLWEQAYLARIGLSGHVFTPRKRGLHSPADPISPSPGGVVPRIWKQKKMATPTKEQIIHRAYELWELAGKPEGRDDEFYHHAEGELNEAAERETKETPEDI